VYRSDGRADLYRSDGGGGGGARDLGYGSARGYDGGYDDERPARSSGGVRGRDRDAEYDRSLSPPPARRQRLDTWPVVSAASDDAREECRWAGRGMR